MMQNLDLGEVCSDRNANVEVFPTVFLPEKTGGGRPSASRNGSTSFGSCPSMPTRARSTRDQGVCAWKWSAIQNKT